MELKSIKLVGFKSFADSTTISIRSQLTAIVGPNGCGKSNVVDAVRWVIGEMSAKQLRGQSMADVIFNGTNNRKPVGKAAVELLFDNSDGRIGGEFASFGEISVRREVEREGQSAYYLNGTSCRRRDILSVFLGTGLGSRSYAIIEQGMISRLIEAKPEDMRTHLEEAAGISKYKERRRDTESRIKRTTENLDRVNDIREELATQCRRLKRQSNAAERYTVLKEEETLLLSQIQALQWQALEDKKAEQNEAVNAHQLRYEERLSRQRQIEADIEKSRQLEIECRDQEAEVQKRYYVHAADIARIEQQIKHTEEQTASWQVELSESESLHSELSSSADEQNLQIDELKGELENMEPRALEIQSAAQQAAEVLSQAEADMQAWQSRWDQFQADSSQESKQYEVTKTTLAHLSQQKEHLIVRLQHLIANRDTSQLQSLAAELEPLNLSVRHAQDEMNDVQEQLDTITNSICQQREQNQLDRAQLKSEQQDLHQQQASLTSLEALQQAALSDEVTEEWLEDNGMTEALRLGDSLGVDTGWELAVETVLGRQFHAICVDSAPLLMTKLNSLSQGTLTFIDSTPVGGGVVTSNKAALLLDKIKCDYALDNWLSGIYAVDDWTDAQALRATLSATESIITRDGIWLGANWLRIAKTTADEGGILLRKQQIDTLQQSLSLANKNVAEQEQDLLKAEARLSEIEAAREAAHVLFKEKSYALSQLQSDFSAKQSRHTELDQQQQRIVAEISEAEMQRDRLISQQQEAEAAVCVLSDKVHSFEEKKPLLLTERDSQQSALSSARSDAQSNQQRADEMGIRVTANENQLNLLQQTVARSQRQLDQVQERRTQLSANLAETGSPLERLTAQLQTELSQHIRVEEELKQETTKLNDAVSVVQAMSEERDTLIQAVSQFKDELQALQMKTQEIKVRQDTIAEHLESTDVVLAQVVESLPDDATLLTWQESAETLDKRISRLGPINLGAITEFETLTERKTYLDNQCADLEEAMVCLDSAIKKIDRETRGRFKDTFEKVNAGFEELFPKIFGGGRAYLELEENDLLTSGVIVKAQPPGKRNTTINLLSGGEKALTAIALVFALFRLNPAPFCILDEVDAPLDDVNVERYCNLVKEMSDTTQFIVISHNKVTISMANQLMGVTMHEAGVSRMVSVDMQEAIEMAEA